MKKLTLLLAILGLGAGCSALAQTAGQVTQGPGNTAGILWASNFGQWAVPQGNTGQFSWSVPSQCNATASGIPLNPVFKVGTPITIKDQVPANTEIVTPSAVYISGSGCSITVSPVNKHNTFTLTSATAGLQEAINYAAGLPYEVILTPDWSRLGGTTAMIAAATGNANVTIIDQRTSVLVAYTWNGSAYAVTSFNTNGCLGGNTIANGCTGATTAAGANLNITGVTQTGTLGTSSQVSTFPGTVHAVTVTAGTTTPTTMGSNGVLLNGVPALQSQTSLNNYYSGGAGNLTGTGSYNTANGFEALYANTIGNYNAANGMYALISNTTGSNNTANGYEALNDNTTGSYNTANGYEALQANTTGYDNAANGVQALFFNTTGSYNTANGVQALFFNTTGSYNTANGFYALISNNTGYDNTANGYTALFSNTTGYNNTANGYAALYTNTIGYNNTANGFEAGRFIADGITANQTSSNSVYEGFQAYPLADGDTNENVIGNTAIGHGSNTTTLGNASITDTYLAGTVHGTSFTGNAATATNVTGTVAIGQGGTGATTAAGANLNITGVTQTGTLGTSSQVSTFPGTITAGATTPTTIGSNGVLLNGVPALQSQTSLNNYYSGGAGNLTGIGNNNIANGYAALSSNTTGVQNTANGNAALFSNTTGSYNTANGFDALFSNTTGSYNTANGYAALLLNTTGFDNTANGMYALYSNTTGSYNTANGYVAGEYIADGVTANQTSSNSVYEGYEAYPLVNGDTNENVIGNTAIGHGSNTTTLGNSSVTATYLAGITLPLVIYSHAGTQLAACASGLQGGMAVVSDATALVPGTAYSVTAGAGADTVRVQCTLVSGTYAWQTM